MDKNSQSTKNNDLNKNTDLNKNKKDTDITTPGKQRDLDQQQTGGVKHNNGVKQDQSYDKKIDRTHV